MISNIIKNDYIVNIFSKICNLSFAIGASSFITRYMGNAIKGDYAYITSFVAILGVLCNLGVYQAYPNQVKNGLKNAKQKFADFYFLQLIIYLSLAVYVYIILNVVIEKETAFLFLQIMLVTSFSTLSSQIIMISIVEHPLFRSVAQIITSFVNFCLCAIVFLSVKTATVLIPIFILLIKDFLMVVLILKNEKIMPKPWNADMLLFGKMVKFGFLPMITSLLLNLNYKMDVFMLKWFTTSATVGIYSIGIYFADQIWLIPDSFKEVLFSRVVKKGFKKSFNMSIKLSIYITLFMCIAVAALGRLGIFILYGREFLGAYYSMLVLLIGIPFMSVFKVVSPLFITEGKTGRYFINLLCGVIINIIMNYMLIPSLGAIGAAIATISSQIACGSIAICLYRNDTKDKISDLIIPSLNDIHMLKRIFNKDVSVKKV